MKITSLNQKKKQKKEKQINLFVLQMNDKVTQKGGKEHSQVTCHPSVRAAYLQSEAKSKISKLIPALEQREHPSILEEMQAAMVHETTPSHNVVSLGKAFQRQSLQTHVDSGNQRFWRHREGLCL